MYQIGDNIFKFHICEGANIQITYKKHIQLNAKIIGLENGQKMNRHFSTEDIDGQQIHKNMVNIANQQGNTNQNHKETLSHTCENSYYKKERNNKCW